MDPEDSLLFVASSRCRRDNLLTGSHTLPNALGRFRYPMLTCTWDWPGATLGRRQLSPRNTYSSNVTVDYHCYSYHRSRTRIAGGTRCMFGSSGDP